MTSFGRSSSLRGRYTPLPAELRSWVWASTTATTGPRCRRSNVARPTWCGWSSGAPTWPGSPAAGSPTNAWSWSFRAPGSPSRHGPGRGGGRPPGLPRRRDCARRCAASRSGPGRRSAGEVVLDIVPHAGGVAGPWAMTVQPGQVVYLTDARGWYAPPADLAWQLLVADLTGVPALGRIVEELPASARAYVIVEVPDPADRPRLTSAATVVRPLSGGRRPRTRTEPAAQRDPGARLAGRPRLRLVRRGGGRVASGASVSAPRAPLAAGPQHRPGLLAGRPGGVARPLRPDRGRARAGLHPGGGRWAQQDDALELYDDAVEAAGL